MKISVVLASFRSPELVFESLQALRPQCLAAGAELIVSRSGASGEPDPEHLLDDCVVVACPIDATLPEVRGAGLAAAKGDHVLLTEDNCVPGEDWVQQMSSGLAADADVVGGTMGNAHPDRALDSGAYYAEYGFFGPLREAPAGGASPFVTGANVAYRRAVVERAASWASEGEWEGVIHHRLAGEGARFKVVSLAVVRHNASYGLREFCRDRFEHGHDYATGRRATWGWLKRLAMATATGILPPLLAWRAWRHAGRAQPGAFLRALPFTLVFLVAWSAGEALAYLGSRRQ